MERWAKAVCYRPSKNTCNIKRSKILPRCNVYENRSRPLQEPNFTSESLRKIMAQLTVHVQNSQKDLPLHRFYRKHTHNIVEHILSSEQRQYHEVSVYFINRLRMCQIHSNFFADPSPTDCISFPIDIDQEEDISYRILGDVFVCPSVAYNYVNQHGGNVYEETTLYVVHGLLHLLGYDDLSIKERKKMRNAEARVMHGLHLSDLCLKPPKKTLLIDV